MSKNNIKDFLSTYNFVERKMKKIAKAINFIGDYTNINFNKYGVEYCSTVCYLGNDRDEYGFIVLWKEIEKPLNYFVEAYKDDRKNWITTNRTIYNNEVEV